VKVKLSAGAEFDMLNRDELAAVLRSWQTEITRGAKLRRLSISGVAVGGVLAIGGNDDGPAEGMAWAVTRLSVAPGPTLPAGGLQVYANTSESPSALLIRNLTTDVFCGDHGCNILGGESLRIAGTGLGATDAVTVTLSIKEVPVQQIWSL
jgi:hypothetical protein